MELLDCAKLVPLATSSTGNKVVRAFRFWCLLHYHGLTHTTHPETGEIALTIDIVGDLCCLGGVTSYTNPLCIRALGCMMLAEYYKSNGDMTQKDYYCSVVESIKISGFTLYSDIIRDCQEQVRIIR